MSSFKDETPKKQNDILNSFIYLLLLNYLTISDLDELFSDLEEMSPYEFKKSAVSEKLMGIARTYAKLLKE